MKIILLSLTVICVAVAQQSANTTDNIQYAYGKNSTSKTELKSKKGERKGRNWNPDKTLQNFVEQEAPWINVFVKHMALFFGITVTVGGTVLNAHAYGMVAAVVFRILKGDSGQGGIFDKLREKVDRRIITHLNREKMNVAKTTFNQRISALVVKMKRRKYQRYQLDDLITLRSFIANMLPTSSNVDYHEEWFVWMAKYMILYKSFYDGLVADEVLHKCIWIYDWQFALKRSLKIAFKRLAYGYYANLKKDKVGSRLWGAYLDFTDPISDPPKQYSEYYTDVKQNVLSDLSDRVAALLMEQIGTAYNSLVTNEELIACDLNPAATRLTAANIRVEYPKSCYGQVVKDGVTKKCDLPCGLYDYSYAWCPYFHGEEIENEDVEFLSSNNNMRGCDDSPAAWGSCGDVEDLLDVETWHNFINKAKAHVRKLRLY